MIDTVLAAIRAAIRAAICAALAALAAIAAVEWSVAAYWPCDYGPLSIHHKLI